MVTSAIVAYLRLAEMDASSQRILEVSVPAVGSCYAIRNAVNRSAAALRGYVMLGDDPEQASQFQQDLAESWAEIDGELANLKRLRNAWTGGLSDTALTAAQAALHELRRAEQAAEAAMGQHQLRPSHELLTTEVMPAVQQLLPVLRSLQLDETGLDAEQERTSILADLGDLRTDVALTVADLRRFLDTPDAESATAYNRRRSAIDLAVEAMETRSGQLAVARRDEWRRAAGLLDRLGTLGGQVMDLRRSGHADPAKDLIEARVIPQREKARSELARLQESADLLLAESRATFVAASETMQRTLLIATLLAVAIAGGLAVTLSRRIARSLQQLVAAAQGIAAGDLRGEPLRIKARDEIADLATAFDAMRNGLKELAGQVLDATENVTSSASEIVASTKQQAAATREQAATVQQITATMKEISESGAQIEERARHVSADAEAASSATAAGTQAAQDANQTMDGVRQQVEEVAENIVSLSGRTQAIGELIATVTDIAEQSNLLALNASIEAVAAGEHGNRFSVVANEMKNLADQAKACTVQVRTILGEIQKGIHASVMLTEEAVKRAEKGKGQTEATEATIRRMAGTTEGCVQAFGQIVGGSNQQQIGVTQVAQGMEGIRQAVEQTATGTSQLEKAASNLSTLSHQLQHAARRYQT
jgi:methyl-accepting chemotaxis protein